MLQKTNFLYQLGQMFNFKGNYDKFINSDSVNFYHRNTSNNHNFKRNQRKERVLAKHRNGRR